MYMSNTNITRDKSITLPKIKKNISFCRCYISAIKSFNKLPNSYTKTLDLKKTNLKNALIKQLLS